MTHSRHRWFLSILAILSAVAVLCALIAAFGQLGRWSERFDSINIILPYLVIPGLGAGCLVLLIGARRRRRSLAWRGAAVAVAVLVLGPLPLLARELAGGPSARDCTGARLRIVQANLWKENPTTEAAARWLRATDADVLLLEETRNRVPVPALLQDRYPYQQSCIGRSRCSTVILSRLRPVASAGLAKGDPENRAALSAAWMRFDAAGGPFTVVAAHMGRPWPFPRFDGDRGELVSFVRTLPAESTILTGDFNLPGWTFQLQALEAALGLTRWTHALPSWPAVQFGRRMPAPLIGIDQIFAGRGWTVEEVRRGPFLGSDHYPVVADLRRCTAG